VGTSDARWLFATCQLIAHAKDDAIFEVVGTEGDASALALAYVIVTYVPARHRRVLVERLVQRENVFQNVAATALAFEWISAAVAADENPEIALFEAIVAGKRPFRNQSIGQLLARLVHWLEERPFNSKRHERGENAFLAGVYSIRTSDVTAQDIGAVLEASGSRAACVLAAMSTWLVDPDQTVAKLAAAVRSGGTATLERLFGSTMRCTDDEGMKDFTQLQPLLGPLITGFSRMGMMPPHSTASIMVWPLTGILEIIGTGSGGEIAQERSRLSRLPRTSLGCVITML